MSRPEPSGGSTLAPSFLARLADPAIRTLMLCGCGGGFDFVHSLVLYPELARLGKRVVVGSYSFGDPERIEGGEIVFAEGEAIAKRVDAGCVADPFYGPEVAIAAQIDAPVYAYYARAFAPPVLARLYRQLCAAHAVDAIVVCDGGSDSLMVGDEDGLGDPIEDAVSIAAVASLDVRAKILIAIGLGTDRANAVSDAASLRAVAELTRAGGFLGAVALEPGGEPFRFYRACVDAIHARQEFRSVLASAIVAATEGGFGADAPIANPRVRPGDLFLWPLMAMIWSFDVAAVAARSRIVEWIRDCATPDACHEALYVGRAALTLRGAEHLPAHRLG